MNPIARGSGELPAWRSISTVGTPRQARNTAAERPTNPPPATNTDVDFGSISDTYSPRYAVSYITAYHAILHLVEDCHWAQNADMTAPSRPEPDETAVLWERTEPAARPAPTRLSRKKIVQAAIAIADKEGLAAVSLRKVGASLNAGAMRLYGYLTTKEELLDLMIDAVYGEIVSMGPLRGDWRSILRTIAHRTRDACRTHKWFVDLLGGRPHMGPNALAHVEACLAALGDAAGFADINLAMRALRTLNAYVTGAIRGESSELHGGMDTDEWQKFWWPYLERLIATGRFPMLARVVRDSSQVSADDIFDGGLDAVLEGIAAQSQRRSVRSARILKRKQPPRRAR